MTGKGRWCEQVKEKWSEGIRKKSQDPAGSSTHGQDLLDKISRI